MVLDSDIVLKTGCNCAYKSVQDCTRLFFILVSYSLKIFDNYRVSLGMLQSKKNSKHPKKNWKWMGGGWGELYLIFFSMSEFFYLCKAP